MKQCMMRIGATGVLGEWQQRLPQRFPGNRMDSVNVLYPMLPTDNDIIDVTPLTSEEMSSVDIIDVSDLTSVHTRVITVSSALLREDSGFIIIAKQEQWTAMYNTTYWRIWCAPYLYDSDDCEQFQIDLEALGMPNTLTRTQARELIKTLVVQQ